MASKDEERVQRLRQVFERGASEARKLSEEMARLAARIKNQNQAAQLNEMADRLDGLATEMSRELRTFDAARAGLMLRLARQYGVPLLAYVAGSIGSGPLEQVGNEAFERVTGYDAVIARCVDEWDEIERRASAQATVDRPADADLIGTHAKRELDDDGDGGPAPARSRQLVDEAATGAYDPRPASARDVVQAEMHAPLGGLDARATATVSEGDDEFLTGAVEPSTSATATPSTVQATTAIGRPNIAVENNTGSRRVTEDGAQRVTEDGAPLVVEGTETTRDVTNRVRRSPTASMGAAIPEGPAESATDSETPHI